MNLQSAEKRSPARRVPVPFTRSKCQFPDNLSFKINEKALSPSFFDGYCATGLCHPDSFSSFGNPYPQRVIDDFDCATGLCHQGDNSQSLEISGHTISDDQEKAKNPARKRPSSKASGKPSAGLRNGLGDHPLIIPPNRRKTIRKGSGLIIRGQMFYVKWKVPKELRKSVGKMHFVRSLRTGRLNEAVRMMRIVGYEFERWLRQAEAKAGAAVPTIIPNIMPEIVVPNPPSPVVVEPAPMVAETIKAKTFETVFEEFVADPTKKRGAEMIQNYRLMMKVIYDVVGRETPIDKVDRELARSLLETLRHLPTNVSKRFPTMGAKAAAEMAKAKGMKDLLGPISINKYMAALSSIMNFALNEGYVDRNPCRGLRVLDPVKLKDKRMPYSDEQLRRIFSSPIYTAEAEAYRHTAKYWVPLIGLYSGMRLNETCALDTADVVEIEGILAFVVAEGSDKSLKTEASKRIVPIHKDLLGMGFATFVEHRRKSGKRKLFPELTRAPNGSYGKEFSKWYGRYMRQIGVHKTGDKTCYHSFRHCFRDAIRSARIDGDIGLSLGGWAGHQRSSVHESYGSGYPIATLKEAVDSIKPSNTELCLYLVASPKAPS